MSITFTDQLDKPSEITTIPNQLLRPIFGASYGFDSTAVAPANTFTTLTVADTDTNAIGSADTITFTVQPSVAIAAGGTLTLTGMQGTQTADNASLTVGGGGAAIFGSSGSWTQSTGTLVLTVAGGQSLPTGSDTVITFDLTNASSAQSGKTVSVSSNTFITANATGTVLDTIAIFNVTTRDTEANILASTPTNPSGEVNIAFGTDTNDFYIYDGSAWYIYKDEVFNQYSVSFDGTDDYLSVSSITLSGAKSVSLWVKFGTKIASGSGATLIANSSGDYFPYMAYGRYLYARGTNNSGAAGVVQYQDCGVGAFVSGQWGHVVISSDGTTMSYYFNGVLKGTDPNVDPQNMTLIGGRATFYHDSLLDEVALFNSALSGSDVTAIYNSGVPADLSSYSPLHWWRMGDGTGDTDSGGGTPANGDTIGTLTDQGSGSNNATGTNGPTFSTTVPS